MPDTPRPGLRLKWLAAFTLGTVLSVGAATIYRSRASRGGATPVHRAAAERGRAHLRQGRPDLAFEAVSSIRDEAPGAGEAMTVAGLALIQYREYRGARLALERALKLEPGQLDATLALAKLNLMLGNGVRGLELLEQAARLDPRDAQTWLTMGRVCHDLGEPAKASRAFGESHRLEPKGKEALVGLVTELLNEGRTDEARPRLEEASTLFPEDPVLLGLAARLAREEGRLDEAIDLASRALKGDPDNLSARVSRARAEVATGKLDRALADLEYAEARNPSETGAIQLLAQVESRLGMAERARATSERHKKASERALAMDNLIHQIAAKPDDPELRWRMGVQAAEGGSAALASQCFQAALALDPGYQPARESLSALRAGAGDVPDALRGLAPGLPPGSRPALP
jgi:predicted Zn-dependent protease